MIENNQIKKLAINGAVFEEGMSDFKEGKVSSLSLVEEKKYKILTAYVQEQNMYRVQVTLNALEDKIEDYSCQCGQSLAYNGMCRHEIAALMQRNSQQVESVQARIIPANEASDVNVQLESLIHHYVQMQYSERKQTQEEKTLQLVPSFYYGEEKDDKCDHKVKLSLLIGEDKLYPVQQIGELGLDFMYHTTKEYSKGAWICHDINSVEGSHKALVNFLMEHSEYTSNEADGNELVLNERMFTTFFNSHKEWETEKEWVSGNPEIRFVLYKDKDTFRLGLKDASQLEMKVLYGGSYLYDGKTVYQVTSSFKRKVWPIFKLVYENEAHYLEMTKEEMPKMKRYLLDVISDYIESQVDEESIEEYVLPDLVTSIHLDMLKKDVMKAELLYQYDTQTYNPCLGERAEEKIRDRIREEHIEKFLESYGFKQDKAYYKLSGESEIYEFIAEGIQKLTMLADTYVSDEIKKNKIRKVKSVNVGIKLLGDFLDLDLSCIGIPKEELGKLLKAYTAKKKYYRLKNGEFVDLSGEGIKELNTLKQDLHLSEKDLEKEEIRVQKYRAIYLDRLLKEHKSIKAAKSQGYRELVEDFKSINEKDVQLPQNIQGTLRDYQIEGYKWIKMLGGYGFGGILADDMGLGKTLQTIAVLDAEKEVSLIVCPTSLVYNWASECEKFAPHLKVMTITGSQAQREEKIKEIPKQDIVVTSYDSLKRDIQKYKDFVFNYCVIDEAQYIKNSNTQNAKAVKEISCKKRMALTGTPIENRLSELWSIFDFIMPGYLFSEHEFRNQIEMPILKEQDEMALEKLKTMISPFILRRLKEDVLDELPDKTETVIYTNLSEEQNKVYLSYAVRAKQELMQQIEAEGFEKSQIKMLSLLTRLRQICCHPSLFVEQYKGDSGKLESCMELVENAILGGHKILIFSQFTSMLEILATRMKESGISYSLLKGDVKAEKRREMVENFNEGETKVFLISLKAGGVGLNLTGADVVIHYDPWWNLAAQNQATDRAYRIGQLNNVQVYKLITKGTIEEKIKQMQDKKQDLTTSVLSTEQTMMNQMTREEILALFE